MSNRRLINVSPARQRALSSQFSWLHSVHVNAKRIGVQVLSVSIFDHWLSREDAGKLLENIPPEEQERRDRLLAAFCGNMVAGTEVLSFVMRGRRKDRCVFRSFKSMPTLANYCRPNGGRLLGQRHFYVVLPELGCAFYESWDDTYHFFFASPAIENAARVWAAQSSVYLLSRNSES